MIVCWLFERAPRVYPRRVVGLPLAFGCVFFNDTATTEIYTLSLHDALPISSSRIWPAAGAPRRAICFNLSTLGPDRKSTRLNSSHLVISYAVSRLKKKKEERPGCRLAVSAGCPRSRLRDLAIC